MRLRMIPLALTIGCAHDASVPPSPSSPPSSAPMLLAEGRFSEARDLCDSLLEAAPDDCEARWCALLSRTGLVLGELNDYLIPTFRGTDLSPPADVSRLLSVARLLTETSEAADAVTERACHASFPHLPVRIGDVDDPIVIADARGTWTPRAAHFIAATTESLRYLFAATVGTAPATKGDGALPGLPALLASVRGHLLAHDAALFAKPGDGWIDRDGDGRPSAGDVLQLDLFEPQSDRRVFDFSRHALANREALPLGSLVPAGAAPKSRCGHERLHVETLFESSDVGTTDGLSFFSDSQTIAYPRRVDGRYQIHVGKPGGAQRCLTCDHPKSINDGVRVRPGHDGTMVYVSNRDHPRALGGAGGGTGQELYAMRADGSGATRLTHSHAWATNYHVNWSNDGSKIVWGTTEERSWDVMVADFVDDAAGMRLEHMVRLTHDTAWWETHGFTHDDKGVIVTGTSAGWQSSDIYAIDIATGARTRLTDHLAWDEHAHLSPDGSVLSWISGRFRPAGMLRLTDGSASAAFDFFWIYPGILFEFLNPPTGFSTELTLASADGTGVRALTHDDQVVADNVFSPDGTKILFRQTPVAPRGPSRIRLLTFDDCAP